MKDAENTNSLGPLSRRALRHHVVQGLLKAIIHGELAAGQRLVTSRLAVQFEVSATPIREALVELEQSRIVELSHHRGAIVKPFGRTEVRDFYAVRGLLEGEAVRLACGRIDTETIGSLRSDLERLLGQSHGSPEKWLKELFAVDRQIHQASVDNCGNKRLMAEIERYDVLGQAMRDIAGSDRAWHQESVVPLVELLDGVQQQRPEVAAAAMRRHIGLVAAKVETAMFDRHSDA